jgi:ATP-dependent Clp protease ATP-binding subunit ClpA
MNPNKYYYEEEETIRNWNRYVKNTHERNSNMWNSIQYNQFVNEEVRRLQRKLFYIRKDLNHDRNTIRHLRNELDDLSRHNKFLEDKKSKSEKKKRKRTTDDTWMKSEKKKKPNDYKDISSDEINEILKRTFVNLKTLDDIINFGENINRFSMFKNEKFEKLYRLIPSCKELNSMIGLDNVKKDIFRQISYFVHGLNNSNEINHVVITGEPGVGKTTLAKIIAKIYMAMGFLNNDKFMEAKRSDLIGQYCGHTAIKTQKVIDSIEGGVLFIDEVYSLGNREKKDVFTKECIDTINQNLTEKGDKFLCIIAGYKEEVQSCFFNYNKGLERRFPVRFELESYDTNSLSNIFIKFMEDDKWNFDKSLKIDDLKKLIDNNKSLLTYQAGDIRTLFQYSKENYSMRLLTESIELGVGIKNLKLNDIKYGFDKFKKIRGDKNKIPDHIKSLYI